MGPWVLINANWYYYFRGMLSRNVLLSSRIARTHRSCSSFHPAGYRVYFRMQGRMVVILLAGGDKRTQSQDVETALRLARNL